MTATSYPACEVLFELFSAPRGKVLLGRVTTGRESGRVVRLRLLGDTLPLPLTDIVATASTLTHPKVVKLLGIVFDGGQYYLASEHLPGVSLFELIARARSRQQGFELAAAVHVTLTALRLVEQAAGLLGAAGLERKRLLYTDSIWIAEFGETLLAEPGLGAHLGRGDPECGDQAVQGDTLTAAVELYHLATGKLLTGDLAAAVREALPDSLAHTLTEVFRWSDTEASDTVSSFARALGRLPPELHSDEPGVARALLRLAGDVLSEREHKLAEYRPDLGLTIDGPTRVYSLIDQQIAPDEPTVVSPRRLQPARPAPTSRAVFGKQLVQAMATVARKPRLEPEQADAERLVAAPSARARRPKSSKGWRAVLVLAVFALGALGYASRTYPGLLRELAARLERWSNAVR
ncbi:MAG TPA: hypothetical protein VGK73_27250 [Polyangiaceae bacterium]